MEGGEEDAGAEEVECHENGGPCEAHGTREGGEEKVEEGEQESSAESTSEGQKYVKNFRIILGKSFRSKKIKHTEIQGLKRHFCGDIWVSKPLNDPSTVLFVLIYVFLMYCGLLLSPLSYLQPGSRFQPEPPDADWFLG